MRNSIIFLVQKNSIKSAYFLQEKVSRKLNLSDKTATKAFKQLNNVKFVQEKRQRLGKSNLIYVGKFMRNQY